MKYSRLGRSGLEVSRFTLGCMSFGDPSRGAHPWTIRLDTGMRICQLIFETTLGTPERGYKGQFSGQTAKTLITKARKRKSR